MMILKEALLEYLENHSTAEDEVLQEIRRHTFLTQIYPQMLCGQLLGKLLEILVTIIKPHRALEIGTFTAYSTICIARGLPANGKLITIEQNEELEHMIYQHLEMGKVKHCVQVIINDALKTINKFDNETFDFIFIDGDKKQYLQYFELCSPKLKKGGLMVVDNTLWGGKVLNTTTKNIDAETETIIKFNKTISNDTNFITLLLPLRDGVTLMLKKS